MVIQIGKNTITSEKVLEAVNYIGSKDDLTKIFVNSIQNIFDSSQILR